MGVNKAHAKEYYAWIDMRRRCNDPKRPQYPRYGGRGISVCDRWNASFADFIADVGEAPSKGAILDRIDNDGNYEPANVKWSTPTESTNNREVTKHVVVEGERMPVEQAAKRLGCSGAAIRDRLRRGCSEEDAGRRPRKYGTRYAHNGKTLSVLEWAAESGTPASTIKARLRRGASIQEAINPSPRIMRGA
jgi:hypothetical protein